MPLRRGLFIDLPEARPQTKLRLRDFRWILQPKCFNPLPWRCNRQVGGLRYGAGEGDNATTWTEKQFVCLSSRSFFPLASCRHRFSRLSSVQPVQKPRPVARTVGSKGRRRERKEESFRVYTFRGKMSLLAWCRG